MSDDNLPPERPPGVGGWGADPQLAEAIALFNRGEWYDCHDLLEDLWHQCQGPDRQALQGLLQIAVAHLHLERSNLRGATVLLGEGLGRLKPYGNEALGLGPGPAWVVQQWSLPLKNSHTHQLGVLTHRKKAIPSRFCDNAIDLLEPLGPCPTKQSKTIGFQIKVTIDLRITDLAIDAADQNTSKKIGINTQLHHRHIGMPLVSFPYLTSKINQIVARKSSSIANLG